MSAQALTVDQHCQEYDIAAPELVPVRDFLAGERTVKRKREVYIPRIAGQDNTEYDAYVERASLMNTVARTHSGILGQLLRRAPVQTLADVIGIFESDADLAGVSLYNYLLCCVSEVLAVGRGATLVDWNDNEKRPYLAFYPRESIIYWDEERINGKRMLSRVALVEDTKSTAKRIRLLTVVDGPSPNYRVEVFETDEKGTLQRIQDIVPLRANAPLPFIPMVMHDWINGRPSPAPRPPLSDLLALNLAHYRLSADHNHGLHFTALPTAWVAGFKADSVLKIGSGVAWVTENEGAKAGYLEFTGAGLGAIRAELDRLEAAMAVMGARMLESQKKAAESADALEIRQGGESSLLSSMADAMTESFTKALQLAEWWAVPTLATPGDAKSRVEMAKDFVSAKMSAAEVVQLVSAWQSGGISRKTLFYNLQQGEILPDGVTMQQEVAAILNDSVRSQPAVADTGGAGEGANGQQAGGEGGMMGGGQGQAGGASGTGQE